MAITSLPVDHARRLVPPRRRLAWYGFVLNLQLVGVALYYSLVDVTLTEPRYVLYGLVWINVGLLAVTSTRPPDDASFRTRRWAVALATAYFGVLAYVGGLLAPGLGSGADGFRIATLTAGWGPALLYEGVHVSFVLMPAYVVGYASLAYLVYVTVLEASGSAVGGLLGLFSCVSCTWPILATVASSLFGGGGFVATSALAVSFDLSTAVFLLTVGLLYWRPGFD